MQKTITLSILALICFTLTNCKKNYLEHDKNNIEGSWKFEKAIKRKNIFSSTDVFDDTETITIQFNKNGSLIYTDNVNTFTGSWELREDYQALISSNYNETFIYEGPYILSINIYEKKNIIANYVEIKKNKIKFRENKKDEEYIYTLKRI